MKITTWNVNSVNARIENLIKFIKKDQSDIYLIQELKCTNENFPIEELEKINYNCYVNGQKAWNGVAILSKEKIEISKLNIPNYRDVNSRFIETDISLKKIKSKIKLEEIEIIDNSLAHKGHKSFQKGKLHLILEIRSDYLNNLKRLEAEKILMKIVKDEFNKNIHALEIRLK